ncbi:hypothetical protein BJ912DRAFT_1060081 [Pholiota molesta]|nr:hypothetical protein BJ912DRAFT_1060081 [Pholiota molesta]
MSVRISSVAASPVVPTNTSVPSVKSSKRFGRSPAQSIAPVSRPSTLSRAFSSSKNKQRTSTSASAVSSILSGMYARPHIDRLEIYPRRTQVSRPSTATSAESSRPESSNATSAAMSVRGRTLSENSLSIAEQSLQTMAVLHVQQHEQPTACTSSFETTTSGRLVGRGGIGSRRARQLPAKNTVIPTLQSLDAALTADSPHIALRPSGRGGLASRPQQLAPPPPPPKSPIAEKQGPSLFVTPTNPTPTFIRPGGRGGIGAHNMRILPLLR